MQKKTILFTAGIITAAGIIIASANLSGNHDKKEKTPLTQEEKLQRGSYLVNAIGCDDCHSPKKMGPAGPEVIEELRFSGYPSERPILKPDSNTLKQGWSLFGTDFTSTAGEWGMSFAANISSDATGIGNWKEEQFIKAIREGKWKGLDNSRPLLPPMPWFVYKNLTDEDLQSIFAYLKTTKPVKNVVPAPLSPNDLKKM